MVTTTTPRDSHDEHEHEDDEKIIASCVDLYQDVSAVSHARYRVRISDDHPATHIVNRNGATRRKSLLLRKLQEVRLSSSSSSSSSTKTKIKSLLTRSRSKRTSPTTTMTLPPPHPPSTASKVDAPPSPLSHTLHLLDDLPPEIQSHLLSFLSVKSLSKGLARVNKYWNAVVDDHVRRIVTSHVLNSEKQEMAGKEPRSKLVFEAQRPIDTIAHQHGLYFSHFNVHDDVSRATTVIFVFEPAFELGTQAFQHDDEIEAQGGTGTSTAQASSSSAAAVARGVPESHLDRVRPEHHSSSVFIPRSSTSRARSRSQSQGPRQGQPATSPRFGEPSSFPTRDIHDVDLYNPLDAYDWAGPLSSSVRRSSVGSTSSHRSHDTPVLPSSSRVLPQQRTTKPTYRMQLDPLDSFETWILTLTLRMTTHNESPLPQAPSFMRWERRIAEGLDRVYRDWFKRPEVAALDEEFGKEIHFKGISPDFWSSLNDAHAHAHTAQISVPPRKRTLEFDSPSAQLIIQPHTLSPNSTHHPALLSTYSHTYLSTTQSSLAYSTFNKSQRVELRFHIDHVEMNAARLASHFEVIEADTRLWESERKRERDRDLLRLGAAPHRYSQDDDQEQAAVVYPSATSSAAINGLFAHRGRARGISAAQPS